MLGATLVLMLVLSCLSAERVGVGATVEQQTLPETNWFSAAGHGVFTHYLSSKRQCLSFQEV